MIVHRQSSGWPSDSPLYSRSAQRTARAVHGLVLALRGYANGTDGAVRRLMHELQVHAHETGLLFADSSLYSRCAYEIVYAVCRLINVLQIFPWVQYDLSYDVTGTTARPNFAEQHIQ